MDVILKKEPTNNTKQGMLHNMEPLISAVNLEGLAGYKKRSRHRK